MNDITIQSELAHEIKNPLSILRANVELISSIVDDDSLNKNFEVMKNEINKINNVINRFLDFTSTSSIENDNIYLKDVIEDIIFENEKTYPKVKISFSCEEKDISVLSNEYHINMIFSNLIKNSIEAMDYNGVININLIQQDGIGIVTIEDNGKGISLEDEKNILEDFYTTKKGGSGIGLTVVKNIINIYNGDFYIKNNFEKGATAVVKLPVE